MQRSYKQHSNHKQERHAVSVGITSIAATAGLFCFAVTLPVNAQTNVYQSYPTAITLSWDETENANGYRICRADSSGKWIILDDVTDTTQYVDYTVQEGVEYTYSIRPFTINNGRTVEWKDDEIVSGAQVNPPQPDNIAAAPSTKGGSITLSWDVQDENGNSLLYAIDYFEIYAKKNTDSAWQLVKSTDSDINPKATEATFDITDGWDAYTVRSAYENINGDVVYSSHDNAGAASEKAKATAARIVSYSCEDEQVSLEWISLSDYAEGLEIVRKAEGQEDFTILKTITDKQEIENGSFTDTDTQITKSYTYTVRAFTMSDDGRERIYGWYEDGIVINILPPMPTEISASYVSSGTPCVQVSWTGTDSEDKCDGYNIYRRNTVTQEWVFAGKNVGASNTIFKDTEAGPGDYDYCVKSYKTNEEGVQIECQSPEYIRATVPG